MLCLCTLPQLPPPALGRATGWEATEAFGALRSDPTCGWRATRNPEGSLPSPVPEDPPPHRQTPTPAPLPSPPEVGPIPTCSGSASLAAGSSRPPDATPLPPSSAVSVPAVCLDSASWPGLCSLLLQDACCWRSRAEGRVPPAGAGRTAPQARPGPALCSWTREHHVGVLAQWPIFTAAGIWRNGLSQVTWQVVQRI